MFPREEELLASWRKLPENERNKYVRSISAMALAYQDIPEKPVKTVRKKPARIKQT